MRGAVEQGQIAPAAGGVAQANATPLCTRWPRCRCGFVLQSGQQFITLVLADAPLEIESNFVGRDTGFVHVGDPVVIKFDTFPYAQYGMAEGPSGPSARTASPHRTRPASRRARCRQRLRNLSIVP